MTNSRATLLQRDTKLTEIYGRNLSKTRVRPTDNDDDDDDVKPYLVGKRDLLGIFFETVTISQDLMNVLSIETILV